MPIDFAPWRTIYGFARRWAAAAIVDSQSVKAFETVGKDTRGWDEAKKINGRKGT